MYDKNYYESGIEHGLSGYQNYRWLPELTLKMAHCLIQQLNIQIDNTVLDYGCAKGYLVKAFDLLDVECYGMDISEYAVSEADPQIRYRLRLCNSKLSSHDFSKFSKKYDYIIAKDVFEHQSKNLLASNLQVLSQYCKTLFYAVPLAEAGRYIIPSFENDITHIIRENQSWWLDTTSSCGWQVQYSSLSQRGVKDNWLSAYPTGNLFVTARSTCLK